MPDPEFVAHCLELLAPAGAPRARRMFGGHGLYVDDLFVALIVRDALYLKADDATREHFRAAGGRPFTYATRAGEAQALGFWTVPDEAMESPREMLPWARRALAAAVAARAQATPRTRRAPAKKQAARPAAKRPAAPKGRSTAKGGA